MRILSIVVTLILSLQCSIASAQNVSVFAGLKWGDNPDQVRSALRQFGAVEKGEGGTCDLKVKMAEVLGYKGTFIEAMMADDCKLYGVHLILSSVAATQIAAGQDSVERGGERILRNVSSALTDRYGTQTCSGGICSWKGGAVTAEKTSGGFVNVIYRAPNYNEQQHLREAFAYRC